MNRDMTAWSQFVNEVWREIPAWREIAEKSGVGPDAPFSDLPLITKQDYLLSFPLEKLARKSDMSNFHLIGASSGFSKTGAVYWPKRPCDERGYMEALEGMMIDCYGIDRYRTLCVECLAFGMWIGGMQIAAAMRGIALSGKHPFTFATPGLDIRAAVKVIEQFQAHFDRILVITNPSNIPLITALLKDAGVTVAPGKMQFPVVGEYYTETFRESVSRTYGHSTDSPFVVWTGYGSADTGDVAAETGATISLRKFYHRHPDLCRARFGSADVPMMLDMSSHALVEIVDGNIVVTKDQFIPLVRYNTKDRGVIIDRDDLAGEVPEDILAALPDRILGVYGRVDNAVVFYGTNLIIDDIQNFLLSDPRLTDYGGLFTVHEDHSAGFQQLEFTVYVDTPGDGVGERYLNALIEYLCSNSAEFRFKYGNLSTSATAPLVRLSVSDIKNLKSEVKHKFII